MVKVACCWDDAVETDIRLVELLKKHHGKANINLGFHYRNFRRTDTWQFKDHPSFVNRWLSLEDLKSVYQGFKIGGHGLFHLNYEPLKINEFVYDQCEDRKQLEDFFQIEVPGMAYPCGRCDENAAKALADAGFAYGRTTGYIADFSENDNPLLLKSQSHFLAPDFLQKLEFAKSHGGKFYFWGHSCEMQDVPEKWALFESYLAALDADPLVQWVDVIDLVIPQK